MSDIVEDEKNQSSKNVQKQFFCWNNYNKMNKDMVKKINTDEEINKCNECRYECLKDDNSKEAHVNWAWRSQV